MMRQEQSGYTLDSYFPPEVLPSPSGNGKRQQNIIHGGWREKICQWSYNVVDHFDLPREIVSISLNYFDRYMASLSVAEGTDEKPGSSGDLALLASLGTLHLATKVHATNHNDYDPQMGPLEEQHHKVPSLMTLANLSRGQFGPASILEMEKLLLTSLQWRLHPPTLYAFCTFLLKLLPSNGENPRFGLKPTIASELFEVAMYVAELSVCDAFFVERQIPSSIIALAAICTAMDDLLDSSLMDSSFISMNDDMYNTSGSGCFTEDHRSFFLQTCEEHLGLDDPLNRSLLEESLERLKSMYSGAASLKNSSNPNNTNANAESSNSNSNTSSSSQIEDQASTPPASGQSQSRPRTNSYNPPTSPSSIADMSLSTINSNIHSMADTTTNGNGTGGGSQSHSLSNTYKRQDSMVSSIACQSKETLALEDDGDEVFGNNDENLIDNNQEDHHSQSHNSHNSKDFRYSPSPPREVGEQEPRVYGYNDTYEGEEHPLRRNRSSIMSCSPIVALR